MDRDTIYLDNDEEITSVVDKLKGTDLVSVDLVIPKEALLLQSVVNLKILKRQAESLGKEIVIVTQDKVGKKLAEQVGIPVIEKPGQEPKEVRMTEGEGPVMPTAPIEVASKKSKSAELADDEVPIEMKENASSMIEPTAEVVTPEGVSAEEDKEEMPSDKIEDPSRDKKRPKVKKWKIIGLASGVVALVLFVVAYIYIPLANIGITLAAEKKKVDFNFTADKSASGVDTGTATVPAREISFDIDKSQKYPATGKKDVGTKASGTVTISNKSGNQQTLVSGSRLQTGNLIFRLNSNVTVGGATVDGLGNAVPGKVDGVSVTADQPGDSYNVGPSSFTFPGLNPPYSTLITASNNQPFSGGTTKEVTFVTQTDINSAKDDIKKQISSEAQKQVLEKTDRNERYMEGALKINEVSADSTVAVNGEANEFEIKAKSNVISLVFKDEDLKKLAEATLSDQIGSGKEIMESDALTSAAEFVDGVFDKGKISGRLSGEAYIATKIDQNKLKINLTGETENQAQSDLKAVDGVTSFEIKHFPSFYKRMPRLKNHIYIKIEISKEQGQ